MIFLKHVSSENFFFMCHVILSYRYDTTDLDSLSIDDFIQLDFQNPTKNGPLLGLMWKFVCREAFYTSS